MIQRTFYPGDRWLYFKIYTAPISTNHILTERIQPLISRWIDYGMICRWFFIRYADTGHHLRLRVELNDLQYIGDAITSLRRQLTDDLENGIISDIRLDSYQREIERYGADNMENCEDFFCKDSCEVLQLLKHDMPDTEMICKTIFWILTLLHELGMNEEKINVYLSEMKGRYQQEFNLSTQQIRIINDEYRKLNKELISGLMGLNGESAIKNEDIAWIVAPKSTDSLLSSLIHMHLNRLFPMNQRLYEYIVYHMAHKSFNSMLKRFR